MIAVAVCLVGWSEAEKRATVAAARVEVRTVRAESAARVVHARARAATAAASAASAAALSEALASAPAWADQPVPQEVHDALE